LLTEKLFKKFPGGLCQEQQDYNNMKRIISFILLLVIVGCEEEVNVIETMEYKQFPGKGFCPIFEITISKDRILRYIGSKDVTIHDTIYESVSTEQLKKLTNAFNDCNYFLLKDKYRDGPTDMATVITSISINGRYKSVTHYLGDSSAPEELKNLYIKINEILNTEKWVGKKPIDVIP
jgi:hypothetical protein